MVKFVATLTPRRNQPRIFENIQVLRDCLATRGHLILGRQARADFKECLSIPCGQLIEDRSPGGVCQGLENIAQPGPMIGKSLLACQEKGAGRPPSRADRTLGVRSALTQQQVKAHYWAASGRSSPKSWRGNGKSTPPGGECSSFRRCFGDLGLKISRRRRRGHDRTSTARRR